VHIPILTFHKLVPDQVKRSVYINNEWVGSIDIFSQMMKWLYVNHYRTISTEEFYKWYRGEVDYSTKVILITFDDGYYDVYHLAYPILKKYNLKATSFLIGSKIKKYTKKYIQYFNGYIGEDVIEKVRKEYPNIEFQSHSYNLHYKKNGKAIISNISVQKLKNDTIANSKFNFTTMAYPYGVYNKRIIKVLEDQGYLCAFTFGPSGYATRNSSRYSIPRIKINCFSNISEMIKWVKY
jgi:peptidoglycan/xylan/chitin deacetylase (PgdA/CDA1 family)